MPLTDAKIRNLKASDKQSKHFDGDGLYLLVTPAGGKGWRFKYRFDGKEKLLSFGSYPEISLSEARQRREEARQQVARGMDPSELRKAHRTASAECAANSFEVVAREWIGKQRNVWTPANISVVTRSLETNVFPWIGKRGITDLKAPELLKVLRRMEERGVLETAHRVRTICGQVFRYAIATGRAERDIAADLRGALSPPKKKHLPAITDPTKVAEFLRAMDCYEGSLIVKSALRLAPLVFLRPGELRKAEWTEIDLNEAEWNIPAEKMKMKQPHLVPLSKQAVEILREIHPLTGGGRYVFPCTRSVTRPMSDMALSAAIRRLGYGQGEMTPHGFRAMARTILDEVLQFRPDFIEHQLAHAVRDPNGRAYNRTSHLAERRKMMQTWADYLDKLRSGAAS
ncbi:tyrosine-type recombinase/integrase [Geoalkalibacter halelectricus]|uniref:Integrase arm-type DNA-binding domain-containing protein n=1 Tax=Geoalkalibacter halelectricus TaxID=2847045 RepID=A0ABY5ZLZ1_9BACT|nr:integrase arm-type DNA-binding domain-containing protein [Geoalkalibacter halelectricus]MDO3377062.1 integrase arm-type DNA-binding domain-containing protein [Geoalkalibacter halelectricus]UWZ79484.1 integrase arm-type DNA-binding domain-containing protein [Geoalkalibacter halelectricus]